MGNLPSEPPPWYNPIKFQRGQDFARRHFAGISLAHFVSLITMLTSPQILKVISVTYSLENRGKTTYTLFRLAAHLHTKIGDDHEVFQALRWHGRSRHSLVYG